MTEYRIATSVLETIVRGSLAGDERVSFHAPLPLSRSHPVVVDVQGDSCDVTVQLDARLGEELPVVSVDARTAVADALGRITGLKVASVDVIFAGVFPVAG
jgi:uncharacterized alkaline shock family protein YloU